MTDLALKIAALKLLSEYTKRCYDGARHEAARVMKRGERLVARSPIDDQKIAVIPMSDPSKVAEVVDEEALTDWLAEHYPDTVTSGYRIIGSQPEVIAVLFEHAPHLIKRCRAIQLEALHEIKRLSATLGEPVGPGGELDVPGLKVTTPDPVLSCRPAEGALDIIRDLHRRGVLDLDGTVTTTIKGGE